MRFAVGYQLAEDGEEPFSRIVSDYRDHIAELYFPWLDMPSGRSPLATRSGYTDWTAQARLEEELRTVRGMGIRLDLLLNANCYGGEAVSKALAGRICSIAAHLEEAVGGLDIVTTTSPFAAHVLKENFPHIERRASVNMRIGEVKGMEYLADLFDSFYIRREYNRDFGRIRELRAWANANGKKLLMLANSGCMNFCSGQTFHDNLVAHEAEVSQTCNLPGFLPHTCWRYLRDPAHRVSVLQNSWVRPEDLHRYEGLFDTVKLATRMHRLPGRLRARPLLRQSAGPLRARLRPGLRAVCHRQFPLSGGFLRSCDRLRQALPRLRLLSERPGPRTGSGGVKPLDRM